MKETTLRKIIKETKLTFQKMTKKGKEIDKNRQLEELKEYTTILITFLKKKKKIWWIDETQF